MINDISEFTGKRILLRIEGSPSEYFVTEVSPSEDYAKLQTSDGVEFWSHKENMTLIEVLNDEYDCGDCHECDDDDYNTTDEELEIVRAEFEKEQEAFVLLYDALEEIKEFDFLGHTELSAGHKMRNIAESAIYLVNDMYGDLDA